MSTDFRNLAWTFVRVMVWAAALTITARWEHGTGLAIGMGAYAWAVPVVVDGYLILSLTMHRDAWTALGVLWISVAVGAVRELVAIPAAGLAVGVASTIVVILYRVEVSTRPAAAPAAPAEVDRPAELDPADRPAARPAAQPAAPAAPAAPAEVDRPAELDPADRPADVDPAPADWPHRPVPTVADHSAMRDAFDRAWLAGRPMTVDDVLGLYPEGTPREAARGFHRRNTERCEKKAPQRMEAQAIGE